jgi:MFS family permease
MRADERPAELDGARLNRMSVASPPAAPSRVSSHSWYVLALLSLVYLFNFLDRQILSILAQAIKADLGVSDARLGFLYGTAFAIFYAVFGIPLARLADVWVRKNVIALGLACWSLMTALSGTASGFGLLALYRIGVGVGESSASPAAYSMLSDSFPAQRRATAFALYAAGLYVGQGIGYYLGGWILDAWAAMYPAGDGPLGLRGWQAAFLAVGLPGLLLALAVYGLREPPREQVDAAAAAAPGRTLLTELSAVLPPLTLWSLARAGASRGALALNLGVGLGIAALSAFLVAVLGPPEQWIALGIGGYAAFSWVQGLALRDRPAFALLFRGGASVALLAGSGVMTVITYAFMFWSAPFLQRAHGVSAREAGFYLMIASVFGGGIGVTSGGWLSDWFKQRWPAGRVHVILIGLLLEIPAGLGLLFAPSEDLAFAMAIAFNVASTLWVGSTNAVITELVIPRMRAIATAVMLTGYTFIGLALGPYAVGRMSDALLAAGHSEADALRWGLAASMLVLIPSLGLLWRGARLIPGDEASVYARARQAGERLA